MSLGRTFQITVGVLALLGCGGSDGIFRKDGFYNARHPYRVKYTKGAPLADRGWVVANYERDGDEFGNEIDAPRYRASAHIDQDQDGVADAELAFPAYDLLLRNRRHAGKIWIRTLPLPPELEHTELRVLALDFIDAVSESGRMTAALGGEPGYQGRRFVTRVLEGYDAVLDGQRAYEVTFETADVDQVRFADDGRYRRTRLVVVRPDFDFQHGRERFPLLLLLGYSNRAEDFERGTADFARLVSGMDIFSERELVERRGAELFECVDDHQRSMAVYVDIDPRGRVEWADTQPDRGVSFETTPIMPCAQQALYDVRFRGKGKRRRLTVELERGRPPSQGGGYARVPPPAPAAPAFIVRERRDEPGS